MDTSVASAGLGGRLHVLDEVLALADTDDLAARDAAEEAGSLT